MSYVLEGRDGGISIVHNPSGRTIVHVDVQAADELGERGNALLVAAGALQRMNNEFERPALPPNIVVAPPAPATPLFPAGYATSKLVLGALGIGVGVGLFGILLRSFGWG